MNEDKLQSAINRGQKARELLDNDLLREAFDKLEADYIAAWRVTRALDRDAREKLWQALQIVGKVRAHLGTVLSNGKVAQTELRMRLTKPR
jgi:hypothetical protein